MLNLQFPICSVVISIILCVIYFSKKRSDNEETKIFGYSLIVQLIGSITETSLYVLGYVYYNEQLIAFLNNFVGISYILWTYNLFYYILIISDYKKIKNVFRKYNWILLIIFLALFISPITLFKNGDEMYAYGLKTDIIYITCGLFILFSIVASICNFKKIDRKKNSPLYVFLVFAIIIMIVRVLNPSLLIISLALTLINLIMCFTIENPDMKMVTKLEFAIRQVEKSNKAKSEFISSMSHEIRTPLNAIVGYGQLIDYAESLEEAKENSHDIVNASNTLLNMLSNVLDISMVDVDSLEIEENNYKIEELVNGVTNLFKYKLEEKRLELKIDIKNIPSLLIGDSDKIKRILANLIDNSVKYTDVGTINLKISGEKKNNDCKVTIVVEDTGKGIDDNTMKGLFTTFNRGEQYMDSNISGMGLGLSITKSLVDLMGGTISCESKLGHGTKFTVTLKQKVGENNESISC